MTYKEAEGKIFDAYFRDEIKPYDNKFCFCGTLSPDDLWHHQFINGETKYFYTEREYSMMERALLDEIHILAGESKNMIHVFIEESPDWEDILFKSMCAALEVLKDIHRERGEKVDEDLILTKRNLETEKI